MPTASPDALSVPAHAGPAAGQRAAVPSTLATPATADGRVAICLGVTGHRDIPPEDYPRHRRELAQLFEDFARRYPHTPLQLICALAEGADRLAAQVALEHGVELIVAMPVQASDYEKDFPASVAEFRALLARIPPDQVVVVSHLERLPADNLGPGATITDEHYVRLGVYIAKHCHVLLALWDGTVNNKLGGTASVVHYKLDGPPFSLGAARHGLDVPDRGPVVHLPARRQSAPDAPALDEATLQPRWLYPQGLESERFGYYLKAIENFNAEPCRRRIGAAVERSRAYLLPKDVALDRREQALVAVFAAADSIAQHHQRRADRVVHIGLTLVGTMAMTDEAHVRGFLPHTMLGVYLAAFASLSLLYLWQRYARSRLKHLDYRALAEGLRVQIFWSLAGIERNPADRYLRKQDDELRWIREALRAGRMQRQGRSPRLDVVFRHWIQDQASYFSRNAVRYDRRDRLVHRIAMVFFTVGLIKTLLTFFLWNLISENDFERSTGVLLTGFLPIIGALGATYGEVLAFGSQSKKYGVLANAFNRAAAVYQRFEREFTAQQAQTARVSLIVELGEDALNESGDWLLMRRERPVIVARS